MKRPRVIAIVGALSVLSSLLPATVAGAATLTSATYDPGTHSLVVNWTLNPGECALSVDWSTNNAVLYDGTFTNGNMLAPYPHCNDTSLTVDMSQSAAPGTYYTNIEYHPPNSNAVAGSNVLSVTIPPSDGSGTIPPSDGGGGDGGANPTAVSAPGLKFVTRRELAIPHPYNDQENNCTIGIGHLIGPKPHKCTEADRKHWGTLSKKQMAKMLVKDMRKVAAKVIALMQRYGVTVNQCQFDALADLVFNAGPGVLTKSKKYPLGKYPLLADAFMGNKIADIPNGIRSAVNPRLKPKTKRDIQKRRNQEAALFAACTY